MTSCTEAANIMLSLSMAMMAACATGWNVWRVTLRMRSATLKAVANALNTTPM